MPRWFLFLALAATWPGAAPASPAQPGPRSVVDTLLKLRDVLRDDYMRIRDLSAKSTPASSAALERSIQVFEGRYRQFTSILPKATLQEPSAVDLIKGIRTEVETYHRKTAALGRTPSPRKTALLPDEEADYLRLKQKLETLVDESSSRPSLPVVPARAPSRPSAESFADMPVRSEGAIRRTASVTPPPVAPAAPVPVATRAPDPLPEKIEKLEESIHVLMKKLETREAAPPPQAPPAPRRTGSVKQENEKVLAKIFPQGVPSPGAGEASVRPRATPVPAEPVESTDDSPETVEASVDSERMVEIPRPAPAPSSQVATLPAPAVTRERSALTRLPTPPPARQGDNSLPLKDRELLTRLQGMTSILEASESPGRGLVGSVPAAPASVVREDPRRARNSARPALQEPARGPIDAPPAPSTLARKSMEDRLRSIRQTLASPPPEGPPPGAAPSPAHGPTPGQIQGPTQSPAQGPKPGTAQGPTPEQERGRQDEEFQHRLAALRNKLSPRGPPPPPAGPSPDEVARMPAFRPTPAPAPEAAAWRPTLRGPPQDPGRSPAHEDRLLRLKSRLASMDAGPSQTPGHSSHPSRVEELRDRNHMAAAPPPARVMQPFQTATTGRIVPPPPRPISPPPPAFSESDFLEAPAPARPADRGPEQSSAIDLRMLDQLESVYAAKPAQTDHRRPEPRMQPQAAARRPEPARPVPPRDRDPESSRQLLIGPLHPGTRLAQVPEQPESNAFPEADPVTEPSEAPPESEPSETDEMAPIPISPASGKTTLIEESERVFIARKPSAIIVKKERPFDVVNDDEETVEILEKGVDPQTYVWSYDDTPIYDIIRDLAEATKMNLIIHGNIPATRRMDLDIRGQHPLQVLLRVLDLNTLEYQISPEGDLITVYGADTAPEVSRTYRFRSDYPVDLRQVMSVIRQSVLTQSPAAAAGGPAGAAPGAGPGAGGLPGGGLPGGPGGGLPAGGPTPGGPGGGLPGGPGAGTGTEGSGEDASSEDEAGDESNGSETSGEMP